MCHKSIGNDNVCSLQYKYLWKNNWVYVRVKCYWYMINECITDWLDWPTDWLTKRLGLFDCLTFCDWFWLNNLNYPFTAWLIDWLTDRLTCLTSQADLTDWLLWLTEWLTDSLYCLTKCQIDKTDWLPDWFTYCITDWPTDCVAIFRIYPLFDCRLNGSINWMTYTYVWLIVLLTASQTD